MKNLLFLHGSKKYKTIFYLLIFYFIFATPSALFSCFSPLNDSGLLFVVFIVSMVKLFHGVPIVVSKVYLVETPFVAKLCYYLVLYVPYGTGVPVRLKRDYSIIITTVRR